METLVNCDIVSDIKRIDKKVGENQLYQDFGGFVLQLVKGKLKIDMNFYGEIVFEIADDKQIEVDFGAKILPTKVVAKGDVVALGRKVPKKRWMYKVKYEDEGEYLETLDMFKYHQEENNYGN